ncbi:hypothetical protein ACTXT7_013513 [Hymenolepis weldensis]
MKKLKKIQFMAVQDLQVDNVGSRKAIFSWSSIPTGSGDLKNLTIYVFSGGSSKNETVDKCNAIGSDINSMRTCTAMALSPNVQYSATAVVCSKDDYGCSVDSDTVDFQTAPPAPVQITAGAIGTKYIEVLWTPALTQGFDGYQVVAIPLSGNLQAKPQTCNATASEKSCVIKNLQSAARYTITVVAYAKTSDGKTLYGDTILFLNLKTGWFLDATPLPKVFVESRNVLVCKWDRFDDDKLSMKRDITDTMEVIAIFTLEMTIE